MSATINEDANVRRKKITGKALIVFVAVIVVLTFFSRTINNFLLPRVTLETPASGALIKEITGNGSIETKTVYDLYVSTSVKVTDVKVSVGDSVKKGQELLTLDPSDLQSQLEDEKDKYAQKKLALEKLVTAGEKLQITSEKLRITGEELTEAVSPENLLGFEKALQTAKQNLDTAQRDYDSSKILFEAGSITANSLTDAKMKLDNARIDYDIAQSNKEKALRDNSRELEKNRNDIENNLKEIDNNRRDIESTNIDIAMAERRIAALKEEINNSTVMAPCDGIVTALNYSAGMTANTSQPLYEIADTQSGFQFTAVVDISAAEYLEMGDTAEITLSALNNRVIKGTVSQIKDNQQQIGLKKDVVIHVPPDGLVGGESGTADIKKNVGSYQTLVSNAAVGQDNDGYFIYVVKEKEGPLGNEFYVEKVFVSIGDSDNMKTAVLNGLSGMDKVVSNSNKPLSDRSSVMLED